MHYLKTYASTECLKQPSTLQTFAFIMNLMKYHVVSSFVTYGSFFCVSTRHQKIKNAIVRNSCSAVVYTACNITHTIENTHCCAFCQLRILFSIAFTWKSTIDCVLLRLYPLLPKTALPTAQSNDGTVICTPCSICKRGKFDQFNTSLNNVYKYPVSIRYC